MLCAEVELEEDSDDGFEYDEVAVDSGDDEVPRISPAILTVGRWTI